MPRNTNRRIAQPFLRAAVFESFDPGHAGWSACFSNPQAVHIADRREQVLPVLRLAEEAAQNDCWAVVMAAYEAAPVFDPAFVAHSLEKFPLVWVAVFDKPCPVAPKALTGVYRASAWEGQISRAQYVKAIRKIRAHIARGDTYQTNYTFPLECRFEGDPWAWYRELGIAQGARYSAYLDLGRYRVLCFSPELFFECHGNTLTTRPMKGTMPRGRWAEEDDERAQSLITCAKNRAENVMIVDLLRNDLGRVSLLGTVRVSKLFEAERYPTLWQMTSTIKSTRRPDVTLTDIFRALFPCGSVTGAPKVSTTKIIRELEPFPRRVYTGAIGFVRPGGDCVFNVAIRTILLDTETGRARFGTGGGITSDSNPQGEYEECLLKASFLNQRWPTFQLVETILLEQGQYYLLERHRQRMKSSARYFGFLWNAEAIQLALDQARQTYGSGCWKLRLLLARDGSISVEIAKIKPELERVKRVAFAPEPVDVTDPFLFHKTTHRLIYERALEARLDADDLIFWNGRGEVTETSLANVVLAVGREKWTPPRSSGLLAGTFREELMEQGEIREQPIYRDDLCRNRSLFLINSVRKWMPAVLVE